MNILFRPLLDNQQNIFQINVSELLLKYLYFDVLIICLLAQSQCNLLNRQYITL